MVLPEQLSDAAMLPHNREASTRLARRKRQTLVGVIVLGIAAIFLVPPPTGKYVWAGILVAGLAVMGVLEAKRVLIFKRDRDERRESSL